MQGMPEEPLFRFQHRVKAVTVVITTAVGVSLLLHDWGPGNVFSPIRPALKRFFNSIYGVEPAEQRTQQQAPQPSQQSAD